MSIQKTGIFFVFMLVNIRDIWIRPNQYNRQKIPGKIFHPKEQGVVQIISFQRCYTWSIGYTTRIWKTYSSSLIQLNLQEKAWLQARVVLFTSYRCLQTGIFLIHLSFTLQLSLLVELFQQPVITTLQTISRPFSTDRKFKVVWIGLFFVLSIFGICSEIADLEGHLIIRKNANRSYSKRRNFSDLLK